MTNKKRILLLTHTTTDNLGDQTIELCAYALVQSVMNNLGIPADQYELVSESAACVDNRYLSLQPADQPQRAEKTLSEADLIIFGGAPVFNYLYEGFSERTAKTLDIIRKYKIPVLFSSIGVEDYTHDNPKCIRLKKALNSSGVKMVTTRDNYDALKHFVTDPNITIGKVSDSAVFTAPALALNEKKSSELTGKKKIGLFVIRGGAFKDNRFSFSPEDAVKMWRGIAAELETRGYDYEFLTSGSHLDEAFLDRLVVDYGFDYSKCVTNLNTPVDLAKRISSYDGMVACRLHPSIISYSYEVPTIGLVWNNKVSSFYESIGYPERTLSVQDMNPTTIVNRLETAITEGVQHNKDFMMSSYRYLFEGIKATLCPENVKAPYSYEELIQQFPVHHPKSFESMVSWKFARLYRSLNKQMTTSGKRWQVIEEERAAHYELVDKYNDLAAKYEQLRAEVLSAAAKAPDLGLQQDTIAQTFPMYYNIGRKAKSLTENVAADFDKTVGQIMVRPQSIELVPKNAQIRNDGTNPFFPNVFQIKGYHFIGWRLRIAIGSKRVLLLDDGSYIDKTLYKADVHGPCRIFQPGDLIPILSGYGIRNCVAEGVWEQDK